MSRALVAPEEVEGDEPPVTEQMLQFLPSWLVSLVVHLTLVLLLATLTVIGEGGFDRHTIVLDTQTAGPEGTADDELLAASLEMPSELTTPQEVEFTAPDFTEVTDVAVDASAPIEMLDFAPRQTGAAEAEAVAPTGKGAAPAQTAIFGLQGEGTDFVYVFDRSQSMNSTFSFSSEGETVFSITPLQAAKAELLRSLGDLGTDNRFHILFYNHEMWMFDPGRGSQRGLIVGTDENKRRAASFIASVYGDGRTRHVPPLEAAIRMRPDVIFLLTDGEDKDDPTPAELARLRKLNKGRTKINVIQFCFEPRTDGALVTLANENGGRHIFMHVSQLAPGLAGMAQAQPAPSPATP